MNQKNNFTSFIFYIVLCNLVLSSCAESTSLGPSPTLASSPTSFPTKANIASATAAIPGTPTVNNKTVILTPDDLFSLPGLKEWSTPDAEDFCENLPQPQVVTNPDELSLLSGRFALCIYERILTAMDLDTGNLVSSDNARGDIALGSPGGSNDEPTYGLFGWNNAYVKNAYVLEVYANHSGANNLSYEYCEKRLQNQTDQGGIYVGKYVGNVACVKTTEGKIALIRVEKIYPAITLSVEFSFAILR